MGEVYRASDGRIGRDVAIKVLPRSLSGDAELLQRFEQEARAAGQLSHPNVLAVYDVGLADGTPYMVTELLEGESLRERLAAGAVAPRQVVEIAEQVAAGLAVAHARGIVHRDMKPENLFITGDGHVKILDFGIAKLTRGDGFSGDETRTVPASLTATGAIIGTASYMAPEQIRGRPTDHRADLFALGAILYEMLTGRKAFEGETPADRMSAILTSEPPALPPDIERAIPGLTLVIRRCLEKGPDARFESAKDLAFSLRVLSETAGQRSELQSDHAPGESREIAFHRLTFREGWIDRAQFAPDGQTVVFGASWEGEPLEIYMTRVGSTEARPLGLGHATVLSVSSSGELAVLLRPRDTGGFIQLGVLARVPLIGGAPRELVTDVMQACWSPDGRNLAVTREVDGTFRLEYPIGTVRYRTAGWISAPRVAPNGERVAFLHHAARGEDAGDVMEVDAAGQVRLLAAGYQSVSGLLYAGDELWFSANRPGKAACILGLNREGKTRQVLPTPGWSGIEDLSRTGLALALHSKTRMRMEVTSREGGEARELSWLEWSLIRDVSADGKWLLFDETGSGGGERHSVFVRPASGGPAIRLGDGIGEQFSADDSWVMTVDDTRGRATLVPVGAGEAVPIDLPGHMIQQGGFLPRTHQVYLVSSFEGGPLKLYRFDLGTRALTLCGDHALRSSATRPTVDGRFVLAKGVAGTYALHPMEGGAPTPLDWIAPQERPVRFTADGTHLFLWERNRIPSPVSRVEVASGRRESWLEIQPRNRSGVNGLNSVSAGSDGGAFGFSYIQVLRELYVVEGLR